jgi:ubiquinone/menaquinone biosynthesis C-methylase UbiE
MIERVLEPEAMETAEEVRQYDAMDHRAVNRCFVDDFLAAHGPCQGGLILDVGTGTARIPIALATADSRAHVLALDLSPSMLAQAEINIASAGLTSRIRTHLGDGKALVSVFGESAFEAVVSNTIVHHIPEPAPALESMARLVAAGGTLMIRDLARPRSLVEIRRLADIYTEGESLEARALFEASLHAALTLEEIQSLVRDLGLSPTDVAMTSDRHWTWTWRRV